MKIMSKVSKANNETSSKAIRVSRLDSRRRSISHSELLLDAAAADEDRDLTPVALNRNQLRPTSMYFNGDQSQDFDRLASEIIDSVRQLEPNKKTASNTAIVRRSSSGYSSGGSSIASTNTAAQRSPRMSLTGLFQRNPTLSKQTSESKRAQFTQQRSHTGLQIFGGRRRSVAITDDAYDAAMRAAKSHLDLHSETSSEAIMEEKSSRSKVSKEPLQQRKHFNERPWIELEKLWRGKLKAPEPDLTQDFLSSGSASRAKKSLTLPPSSSISNHSSRIRHSRTQVCIPPPPPLTKPKRHTINGPVIKKAIHLMSNEVLDNWRLQLTDFDEANSKSHEAHFSELLKVW